MLKPVKGCDDNYGFIQINIEPYKQKMKYEEFNNRKCEIDVTFTVFWGT